jgi:hypothetical protein
VDTPFGRVETAWRYTDEGLALGVSVPVNATAALTLEGVGDVLRSDGADFEKGDACLTVELPSGSYDFLFAGNKHR